MKIILSNEEIAPALEMFRALHDPDNTLPLKDIIDNYQTNQMFVKALLGLVMLIIFVPSADDAESAIDDIDYWFEEGTASGAYFDNLVDIQVLGESCDIVLTFQ